MSRSEGGKKTSEKCKVVKEKSRKSAQNAKSIRK